MNTILLAEYDDLAKLNRRIAAHWLGDLHAEHKAYLCYVSVCLGQFTHSAADFAAFLACSKQRHHNSIPIARLNRQYLRFARLAAKDVAASKLEMLIKLGITLDQAEALKRLSNKALNRLAFGWDGPIIQFESGTFDRGVALHVYAGRHHATAFVATFSPTKSEAQS